MLRSVTWPAICALLILAGAQSANADDVASGKVQTLTTADGVNFSILGKKPAKPAPTLFIFALDAQHTLGSDVYRQAANFLAKQGYVCVSLDLPCHGEQRRPGEAAEIKGWRQRVDGGENFMDEFTTRASRVLDYLIKEQYTDPARVAACGTSRGGFSACHFAIADPRVKCVAAYIPVADLRSLREFEGAQDSPLLDSLSLIRCADKLADRGVWISIGDRDERVSTDRAIELARALSAAAKGPSRNIQLHVSSVDGHAIPPDAARTSAAWINDALAEK
ncbi:alpha/beta hydrolase family protein [Lacipirellula sp.]|uniref:alpha/beta hydrolase family protein n=1 Tax=Lacipirellula sp. TaxID=2691419 RepID=UPI003D0E92BF